jgi:hypothetical protein
MLAHVLLYRRPTRGLVAAMLAFSVFVAWEAVIAAAYGESHFLHAWRRSRVPLTEWVESKLLLAWPLATVLGAVTPYLGLLAFAALGASRRLLIAVGTATVLGYLLVAVVPQPYAAWLGGAGWRLHLDDAVFGAAGLLLLSVLAAVCWRLYHVRPRHQEVLFLLGWLLLEVAAYFALTPFPAARRVFGLLVVFTLLAGRLASRTCRTPQCQPWAGLVLLSGLLGFLFWMVDLCGASAQQRAAELVVERIKAREPAATIWFVGHWGFQFYAERAGARPVIPNVSRLRPGDWLLVPAESHVHQQRIVLDPACLRENDVIALADALPLRTVACYYGGHIPLERQEGPRVVVHAYVVRAAYVPAWRPSRGSRVPQPAAPARGCCIRCVVLSS